MYAIYVDLWLMAAVCLPSAAFAAASVDYTQAILSSGTIKLGDWQNAYDKASALVDTLSFSEKLSIITGGKAGNLPTVRLLDSSSNPINYYFVTAWPAPLAMAMTWDKDLVKSQGKALGAEFKGKGVNVGYGPTMQPLGRSPWGGRNAETYGPDSYFSGIMGGQLVSGISSAGCISGAKHFILNEQETNRQGSTGIGGGFPGGMGNGTRSGNGAGPSGGATGNARPSQTGTIASAVSSGPLPSSSGSSLSSSSSDAYSAKIDDKAFHETYVAPFYDAVKNGVGAVMCSMNRINGTYGCESQDTLSKVLKAELGFPGFVSPDAGAQKTGINSANAGLDYGSSSSWSNTTLGAGLTNGSFTEARLNDMVIRNLMGYFHQGQDKDYPTHAGYTDNVDVRGNHSALARKFAQDSITLLKNKNNALPLTRDQRTISIFGLHAGPRYLGPNTALTVQSGVPNTMDGHMSQIGGSAMSSGAYLVTPFQAFNERAAKDGFMLKWWLNNTVTASSGRALVSDGSGTELGSETTSGIADNADACIVFINSWSGEGADRTELANVEQDKLVHGVADICNNTIVVVNTVGPRLLAQWDTHENVTAILYAGPLGQESGYAINDVLFGDVNPAGKLVHTIAQNESDYDTNVQISKALQLNFTEGNYVDYKYFDKQNSTPAYEFGFGLSYTTFAYGPNITINVDSQKLKNTYATAVRAVGGREDLWDNVATVSSSLSNTGKVAGAEIAQLYVEFPAEANEPIRQLRGFQKVLLQPGQSSQLSFELRRRDLSVWDVQAQEWAVVRGEYKFWVGASSRDLKASGAITVQTS